VLLAALVGWPLPRQVPDVSGVTESLTDGYVSDEVLVNVIAIVCWLIWAQLVASIVIEAIASIRGRNAGSVPLSSNAQRVAGRLVAAIALLIVILASRGGQDLAQDAIRPLVAPQVVAVQEIAVAPAVEAPVAPAPIATTGPTYTVEHRDTLWDIAETHLGDPFRWTEIWELNRDVPQADGTTLCDPDRIYVGWQLQMPLDAVGVPGQEAAPAPAPTEAPAPVDAGLVEVDQAADADAAVVTPDLMRPVPVTVEAPTLQAPADAPAVDATAGDAVESETVESEASDAADLMRPLPIEVDGATRLGQG
jgi:LysM repeat protein